MRRPKEIKRIEGVGVQITWSDNITQTISNKILRENCPSAVSLAKRGDSSHEKPLSGKPKGLRIIEASLAEELKLEELWAIGNYAIGLRWADGHDSGIFTYELLEKLAEPTNDRSNA